jgi:hypothetical protein
MSEQKPQQGTGNEQKPKPAPVQIPVVPKPERDTQQRSLNQPLKKK